jgi:hypothetical protein
MPPSLRYSLATVLLWFILIPIHECGHLLVARAENLRVASWSLFGLNPSVVLGVPGTVEFFLAGPILSLAIVGTLVVCFWKKPFRDYMLILLVAEVFAGFVDFLAVIALLH